MAESIFTDQVPALADANDNTAYTLATLWTPSADGTVTHGRWRFPATLPSAPVVFALYRRDSEAAGEELARATFVDPTAGTWNTVALASPEPVIAGTYYYATIWTQNRYVATGGFFTATSITSGHLTAPADDVATPRRNGRLNDFGTEPNYPDLAFEGGNYFVDVVFEPSGGVVANPVHVTLVANTETELTLDGNYGHVEVTVTANPALIYVNTKDVEIPTVAGALSTLGDSDAIPPVYCAKVLRDETSGTNSKVRLRSAGAPTLCVKGL